MLSMAYVFTDKQMPFVQISIAGWMNGVNTEIIIDYD